jgi:hypothetical protein
VEQESEADDVEEEDEGRDRGESRDENHESLPHIQQAKPGPSKFTSLRKQQAPVLQCSPFKPSGHMVAVNEGEWFLCEVCIDQTGVPENYTRLSYTVIKGINSFASGDKPDLHITLNKDILLIYIVPEPVNNRGHLGLNATDLKKPLAKMVMVFS